LMLHACRGCVHPAKAGTQMMDNDDAGSVHSLSRLRALAGEGADRVRRSRHFI
jgi:hypothetical protein